MPIDLITGATGFIGRHLRDRLIGGRRKIRLFCRPESAHKLPSFENESVEIFHGDLHNRDSINQAMYGVKRVFHCAGHVLDWGAQETFHATNVRGTQWLLDAAVEQKVSRFIHLSSIAVFGIPSPAYFDDETPYNPGNDHYSQSKIESEIIAFRYFREKGLPVVVLRPAVVYGPYSGWVEEPIRLIRKNKMFLIGGGKGICHPCHINNLIDAMLLASDHPDAIGMGYNVSDDQSITFKVFFNHLAKIVGAPPVNRSIPLPLARIMATILKMSPKGVKRGKRPLLTHAAIDMLVAQSTMRMDKIRNELNFEPEISVECGMELLKQWIELSHDSSSKGYQRVN